MPRASKADDKATATKVASVIDTLNKQFGDGTIVPMQGGQTLDIPVIPTGSIGLDLALGVGGVPRGRITELFGPEASGKTTICQHVIAEAQAQGLQCAYVDMEHALDPRYAAKCGVDVKKLYLAQPDSGEQALEITQALVQSRVFGVVVVDSVAALVPQKEQEDEMGSATMGQQARLMGQAMRKINPYLKAKADWQGCALLFTNQLRMKIGVMFGNPETTTGGMALRFYASVRLDVRKIQAIKEGQEVIGSRVRVRVTKNKVAPPFRETEFDIMYNEGISKAGDIVDLGAQLGIIEKRGAFFSYNETRIGQGRENAKTTLKNNPALLAELDAAIRAQATPDKLDNLAGDPEVHENGAETDD